MPTAYTADVADGKITELEPFAMQLARGMGALIMMRDSDWNAPVPDAFEPSKYNADKLVELRAERDRLRTLSVDQLNAAALAEVEAYDASLATARSGHSAKRARYADMIAKVEAWEGAPEGIKEFGLQQLRESMDFDCREPFKFYSTRPSADGPEWLAAKMAEIEKRILYHAKAQAEEDARTEGRNAWLTQLRNSLSDSPVSSATGKRLPSILGKG